MSKTQAAQDQRASVQSDPDGARVQPPDTGDWVLLAEPVGGFFVPTFGVALAE